MNTEIEKTAKSKGKSKIKTVNVCLTPTLIEQMDKLAESRDMMGGRSIIIRQALKEYLQRHVPAEQLTQEAA